jgi:hypothetical protein
MAGFGVSTEGRSVGQGRHLAAQLRDTPPQVACGRSLVTVPGPSASWKQHIHNGARRWQQRRKRDREWQVNWSGRNFLGAEPRTADLFLNTFDVLI